MKPRILIALFCLLCIPAVCFAASGEAEILRPTLEARIEGTGYRLAWEADTEASYYEIYAGSSPDALKKVKALKNAWFGSNEPIGTNEKAVCEMLYITGRRPVFFAVRAVSGNRSSELSAVASQLAAPRNLLAIAGGGYGRAVLSGGSHISDGSVRLSWKPVNFAESYTVYYEVKTGGNELPNLQTMTVKTAECVIEGSELDNFSVCANFGGGASEFALASGTAKPVRELRVTAEGGRVEVTWNAPDDGYAELITGYRVYRASSETAKMKAAAVVRETSYMETDAPLSGYYIVVPLYGGDEGAISERKGYKIEFPDNLPHSTQTGASEYIVVVNKATQHVLVYGKDKHGMYTVQLKSMICSTGRYSWTTPTGKYTLGERVVWRDFGNAYAKYATYFSPNLMLHSVLYRSKNDDAVIQSSVNGLGTPQSAGCVRLKTADAKWIYDNCASGTILEIVSGEKE